MKKIHFLLILAASAIGFTELKAQNGKAFVFPVVRGDTLVTANAFVNDSCFKVIPITAGYASVGIEAKVRVTSGTLLGKCYLLSSYDNVNWKMVDSVSYVSPVNYTGATATTTKLATFERTAPGPVYFTMIVASQQSTCTGIATVSYTARKYSTEKP